MWKSHRLSHNQQKLNISLKFQNPPNFRFTAPGPPESKTYGNVMDFYLNLADFYQHLGPFEHWSGQNTCVETLYASPKSENFQKIQNFPKIHFRTTGTPLQPQKVRIAEIYWIFTSF